MLLILLLIYTHRCGLATDVLWDGRSPLELNKAMMFTVGSTNKLSGNETWKQDAAYFTRETNQYLHFQTRVFNQLDIDQALWFAIPFPAIQHLKVTDGRTV